MVGGSLAGLRAAEGMATQCAQVQVTVIGDESVAPYSRPELSKGVLAGVTGADTLAFRQRMHGDPRVTWRLGTTVVDSDLDRRQVHLDTGEALPWDALVVASGLRARRLDAPGPASGRHVVRDMADVHRLRTATRGARNAVVVGAGVLGCELASTLRSLGLPVTLVHRDTVPLRSALGPVVGRRLQWLHERRGVRFRLGEKVAAYSGTDRVSGVELASGDHLPADLVVEAVGSLPNTQWLRAEQVDRSDGVLTGNDLLVAGRSDVAACGDVVRFPNPLYPYLLRRVEHWTMAGETSRRASASLLAAHGSAAPAPAAFAPLPYFWSEQHGMRLQGLGLVDGTDETSVLEGGADGEAVYGHRRAGRLVAVTLLAMSERLPHYRELLVESLARPPAESTHTVDPVSVTP